jgi:hypothetical protein
LAPMEYTRLDRLVDAMFTTAKDVESAVGADVGKVDEPPEPEDSTTKVKGVWQFTDRALLQAKRDQIVTALAARERTNLIKKSRALYWDAGHKLRAAFTISKRYTKKGVSPYWYAYHPGWDEFLGEGERAFLVLGCMDLEKAFAVPLDTIRAALDALHTTEIEDGSRYWHIYLYETKPGEIALMLPKRKTALPLSPYEFSILS